jgi:hypothetical protein
MKHEDTKHEDTKHEDTKHEDTKESVSSLLKRRPRGDGRARH